MAKGSVVGIGPIPPPTHGASVVTEQVLQSIGRHITGTTNLVIVDTGSGNAAIALYHLRRLTSHLRACITVIRSSTTRPRTVYIAGSGGAGLWYQYGVMLLAGLFNYRVVFHHHSYAYIRSRALPMDLIDKFLAKRPTKRSHIFLTERMRYDFEFVYFRRRSSAIISNASFIAQTYADKPNLSGTVSLLHISNLSVSKGSVEAIRWFEHLKRCGRVVSLTMAGPVTDRPTLDAITLARTEHPDTFHYIGPVGHQQIADIMAKHDIFLFPSRYSNEAQPLIVLEALASGLPVVATPVGSLESILPQDWIAVSVNDVENRVGSMLKSLRSERTRARGIFEESRMAEVHVVQIILGHVVATSPKEADAIS